MPDQQPINALLGDLSLKSLHLAQGVEKLATINGEKRDYEKVSLAAEAVSESLREIADRHRAGSSGPVEAEIASAHRELEKILKEVGAIQKLHPHGTMAFQLKEKGESQRAHDERMQSWELHGRQIRAAQLRLSVVVEDLRDTLASAPDTPFDRRTAKLIEQVGAILSAASTDCLERSREMLSISRFLRVNADVAPETWADYSHYICMLTGRKNDGSVDPATFFYSNVREYVLARLEQLAEVTKIVPYVLQAIALSSSVLPEGDKAKYSMEHDAWADQFFVAERRDFARNMNDRLQILGMHQERYAGCAIPISSRQVYAHLRDYEQKLECVVTHLDNAERIIEHFLSGVMQNQGMRYSRPAISTVTFPELEAAEQSKVLAWMVEAASKSAGEKESREIETKGYFPKAFQREETFRSVLSLEGARLTLVKEHGQILGCAVALHGDVPENMRSLKERYADSVRIGVAWWMSIPPEQRGRGIYDMLNDELLLDATGKCDALVGRVKVGDISSRHAFSAHLRRLHLPVGGFEQLPHGLHMHLISFVSPGLRSLYFDYLKIDQDFEETGAVVDSQCELARQLEKDRGNHTESALIDRQAEAMGAGSRVAELLLRQAQEPWGCRFDPEGFFHMLLLFDEKEPSRPI